VRVLAADWGTHRAYGAAGERSAALAGPVGCATMRA